MDLAGYRPTLSEVAALFGKSSRWISDLRAKGELPADGATLAEFVAGWTSAHAGSAGGKSIDVHKARLAAAKADQAEIKSAQLRAELLPAISVTAAVQGAFARVRSKLLGLPSKIAPRIASMTSAVAIEEAITELVHEALAELAATSIGVEEASDPSSDSAAPGRVSRSGRRREPVVAGADPAAQADGQPVGGREPVPQRRGKRRTG